MTRRGRPLRFLALVFVGWTGGRVALLWPRIDSVPALIRAVVPLAPGPIASARAEELPVALPIAAAVPPPAARVRPAAFPQPAPIAVPLRRRRAADPTLVALAMAGLYRFGPAETGDEPSAGYLPPPPAMAPVRGWRGSSWLIARGGGAPAGFGAGQLGGAQGGVRLLYPLDRRGRVMLATRVAAPLRTRQREASVGIAWQPTRLPVQVVAEQRMMLDGGRGGAALGLVGGFGPAPVAAGFRLEGYAQAGAVRRRDVEPFGDGALRVAHPLASGGGAVLDLGIGAWGGAQPGVARLDLGPSLSLALPLAQSTLRLSVDWRQRVAGAASPGSGIAVSLGTDF